jgi:small subunit ribosomal protein S7
VGFLTKEGNKVRAEKVFSVVLDRLGREFKRDNRELLEEIVNKVKPTVILRPHIVSGMTYRIPSMVPKGKEYSLALRWILASVAERKEYSLEERLFGELADILKGVGATIKKREEVHKTALLNRPFLKYLRNVRKKV